MVEVIENPRYYVIPGVCVIVGEENLGESLSTVFVVMK